MSCASVYQATAIVSCYNASALLPGCLEDLFGQTLYRQGGLEIIVIDSGSAEGEHAVVAGYQKRYSHIRLLRTERETVYASWNRGIQAARGRYISNANTDDAHRADALEILCRALEAHPEADLAYGHCAFTRRPNDTFPSESRFLDCWLPAFTPALGMFYCLLGPHPVWRRAVFEKIGYFDPTISNAGDYDFQMRFIQAGLQAVWVPEILSLFYQNPTGLSLSSNKTLIEAKAVENRYRGTVPISRLYEITPGDARGEAAAWVHQGNLALTWECAWQSKPKKDFAYARRCYERAMEIIPGYSPAVRNMAACFAAEGRWPACEDWLKKHAPLQLDKTSARDLARMVLQPVDATPRVRSCVFPASPHDDHPDPASKRTAAMLNPLEDFERRNTYGETLGRVYAALAAISAGKREDAARELEEGLALAGDDHRLALAMGMLLPLVGRVHVLKALLESDVRSSVPPQTLEALGRFTDECVRGGSHPSLSGAWFDEAMRTFRELEYRALGLPGSAAAHLLAGASAAAEKNLKAAFDNYVVALQHAAEDPLFVQPLRDKVRYLHAMLENAESEPMPLIQTCAPANRHCHSVSRLCRQEELETREYAHLCRELGIAPDHYERKNWEFFFVAQALSEERMLEKGRLGLGFGVGREKLVAYFAREGCKLLATDVEPDSAARKVWVESKQHCDGLQDLFSPGICDGETFRRHTRFEYVDMNRIPERLKQSRFDFTWSCCAFEHLGSIEQGKRFILDQMGCLRPGGIALHTTEFNLSSDVVTTERGPTVIFRKKDIEEMARLLRAEGHEIVIDYGVGNGVLDRYVDIPPYMSAPDKRHLRLLLCQFVTTSIGLFIRKKG